MPHNALSAILISLLVLFFAIYLFSALLQKLRIPPILGSLFVVNFRSLDSPLLSGGIFTNPWVLIAIGFTVGLQICAVYAPFLQTALHTVPLRLSDWGLILALAAPVFIVTEFIKWFRQRASMKKVSAP